MSDIKFGNIPSPSYVIDEELLEENLKTLKYVEERAGCKILLALKAFSMYCEFPLIRKYLSGATASGLYEARLAREEMDKEVHIYSPAYDMRDFDEILGCCDHIIFNSCAQWEKFRDKVKDAGRHIECGLRVNPEYSEIETDIYNPCFDGSRLGTTLSNLDESILPELDGLHFHTMCEQGADTLERTLAVFEEKFGKYIPHMKWVNFGGGHHITRRGYDVELLIKLIKDFKAKYGVEVYLEPGEAVALNCGYLVVTVLDVVKNGIETAILDASAACHMPDVLEMPYRPNIIGAGEPNEKRYTYRLGGPTCLAGDVIGDYSFDKPLKSGDTLVFCDMAIYTMVKNNTFNGMKLPSIVTWRGSEGKVVKHFGYEDFKRRI